jgi:hypothetical protein
MESKFRPGVLSVAALLGLLSCGIAAAQTLQTNVTYDCDGERMHSPVGIKLS